MDTSDQRTAAEPTQAEVVRSHVSTIARGSLLVFVGNVAGRFLRFLYTLALTRSLGRELFGLFSLAFNVHRIALQIARNGLPHAVVKFVSHHHALHDPAGKRAAVRAGVGVSLVSGTIMGGGLFLLAPWLAQGVYQRPELLLPLRILAASVLLSPAAECLLSALQGVRDVTPMVIIDSLAAPLLLAGGSWVVVSAWRSPAAAAAVYASVAGVLLLSAGVAVLRRVLRDTDGAPARPVLRPLLLFALPLMVIELSSFGLRGLDIVILGNLLPAADLGIYAGAMPIASLVGFGLVAVRVMFSPTISMLHARGRHEAMRQIVVLSTAVGAAAGIMVFGLLLCFDEPMMRLLGREFAEGAPALLVLACGWLVNTAAGAVAILLIMTDRPWVVVLDNVIFVAALVAGMYLLVPAGGLLAAAGVAACANAGSNIVRTVRTRRIHGFWTYDATTVGMWAWFALGTLAAIGIRAAWPDTLGRVAAFAAFSLAMLGAGIPLGRRTLLFMKRRKPRMEQPPPGEDLP